MKYKLFSKLALEVSHVFRVDEKKMFAKNKDTEVVDARFLLYYLCKINKIKQVQIQNFMLERGYDTPHTSIAYGVRSVTKKVEEDNEYQ